VDYTQCTTDTNVTCADYIETHLGATNCTCKVPFELTDDFPVFVFVLATLFCFILKVFY